MLDRFVLGQDEVLKEAAAAAEAWSGDRMGLSAIPTPEPPETQMSEVFFPTGGGSS
jgi:hypothetical protein